MSHPRHPKAYKGGGTEVFGKLLEFGIHTPSFAWAGARRGIRATTLQGRIAPLATLLVRPTIYGPGLLGHLTPARAFVITAVLAALDRGQAQKSLK